MTVSTACLLVSIGFDFVALIFCGITAWYLRKARFEMDKARKKLEWPK